MEMQVSKVKILEAEKKRLAFDESRTVGRLVACYFAG